MAHPSLASAVVLPSASPSPESSPKAGIKRAHDDTTDTIPHQNDNRTSPKRQRKSRSSPTQSHNRKNSNNNGATTNPTSPLSRAAAKPSTKTLDETKDKRRNQRLFGALLGTTASNRTSRSPRDPALSQRRLEADIRRKEQAQKREAEIAARQASRLQALNSERKIRQRRVDERDLRVRHAEMRAQAGFLRTQTEPRLFYLPWKLRDEEVGVLEAQKKDMEVDIDAQLDEFAEVRRRWREDDDGEGIGEDGNEKGERGQNGNENEKSRKDDGRNGSRGNGETRVLEVAKEVVKNGTAVILPEKSTAEERREEEAEHQAPAPRTDVEAERDEREEREEQERKGSIDDTGDVVVEGEEDTVIY